MKKLHLIRHAKSSWTDRTLADIDRPLNKRGLKSCQVMAKQILHAGCRFEHVFCSTAVRAQLTIENIYRYLPDLNIKWTSDEALYTFKDLEVLAWCQSLDNSLSEVVIVGHNPAMTTFCNEMSGSAIENIPTCGYAQLLLGQNAWEDLSPNSAKLIKFLKPSMFM